MLPREDGGIHGGASRNQGLSLYGTRLVQWFISPIGSSGSPGQLNTGNGDVRSDIVTVIKGPCGGVRKDIGGGRLARLQGMGPMPKPGQCNDERPVLGGAEWTVFCSDI